MRTFILWSLLYFAITCYATEALAADSCPPNGTVEVNVRSSDIDKSLDQIAAHAKSYPPTFDSAKQRDDTIAQLKQLLILLEAGVSSNPNSKELLFRLAFANAMGHNLDLPGADRMAIDAYEKALKIDPDDGKINFFYGAFLSSTKLLDRSPPYLRKAIAKGIPDAHYTLGFVYFNQGRKEDALVEFKEYLKADPLNKTAQTMVSEIESGQAKIKTFTVD
ncbi:MAG: tetratricopeptide repeat protein [Burkholderiales bacterium]|nr:tetratricopeptide repeat protein [Burkholderiales bacterium]